MKGRWVLVGLLTTTILWERRSPTLRCWPARTTLDLRDRLVSLEPLRLLPKSLPSTLLKVDLLRCGFPSLVMDGGVLKSDCRWALGSWMVCCTGTSSEALAGTWTIESRARLAKSATATLSCCGMWWEPGNASCLSAPSPPNGVAIPVPGARIGNSSSSIGIGAEILPRIVDEPVLERAGLSAFHFP